MCCAYVYSYNHLLSNNADFYIHTYVGSDRPEITQLYSHVKQEVSPNWFDFGVQLLNTEQARKLKTIKVDYPGDSEKCCAELFNYWLQVDTSASWDKLITALQRIDYVVLADRIRAMTSECM